MKLVHVTRISHACHTRLPLNLSPVCTVCMYVCMYVCMCIYVCMYVCMRICMYVCVCVCMYVYITLLSVYAPTHRSCPGYHGVGELNESGEDLLSFCALNELTIMNTMFEKASIFKHTWQHPGTKHWRCIDYIIMRRADRSLCYDVSVRRSAECWTDHKLLCAKLGLKVKRHRAVRRKKRKYAVTLLRDDGTREEFNAKASKLLSEGWRKESSATSKWEVIRDSLLEAATYVCIGMGG